MCAVVCGVVPWCRRNLHKLILHRSIVVVVVVFAVIVLVWGAHFDVYYVMFVRCGCDE
jgi:hypothetical protein